MLDVIECFCEQNFSRLGRDEFVETLAIKLRKILHLATVDEKNYTRTPIFKNDQFEVLLLRWPVGSFSKIHDHNNQTCSVYLLKGELSSFSYHFNQAEFIRSERQEISGGKVYTAVEQNIHSIHNFSERVAYTLHVYSNPIKSCRVFDSNGNFRKKDLAS